MPKSARTCPEILLRLAFKVELARGASHISSTTSSKSTDAAVAEVLDGFIENRGSDALDQFRAFLIQDLTKRGCAEGALAVSSYRPEETLKITRQQRR